MATQDSSGTRPEPMRPGIDGPMRRDYGPKGCAGIVLAPLVVVALLVRGGRRG